MDWTRILAEAESWVRHNLSFVPDFQQSLGHRFGAVPIFLRSDTNAVQLAAIGLQLAQKGRVALLAQIGSELVGVLLVREAAKLHGPHAGRGHAWRRCDGYWRGLVSLDRRCHRLWRCGDRLVHRLACRF